MTTGTDSQNDHFLSCEIRLSKYHTVSPGSALKVAIIKGKVCSARIKIFKEKMKAMQQGLDTDYVAGVTHVVVD